jgi:hypothetical protein
MTGELLFLRYTFPCATTGVVVTNGRRWKIAEKDLIELDQLVRRNKQPTCPLLERCFPNAVERLREYAVQNGLAQWAVATVADFWHHHHGHEGECRVRRAKVAEASNGTVVVLACEGETLNAVNQYHLPLSRGQFVYFHRRVVVEIEEVES